MRSSQLRLLIFGLLLTVGAFAVVGLHPVTAQSYGCYYNYRWGQWICSYGNYPYYGYPGYSYPYYPYYGYGYYRPGCTYTYYPYAYPSYSPYFWYHYGYYYTVHC